MLLAVVCCRRCSCYRCGQINDALLRTLDAEREGTPIAVEDGLGGAATGSADLLDLDGGSDDPLSGKVCVALALVALR